MTCKMNLVASHPSFSFLDKEEDTLIKEFYSLKNEQFDYEPTEPLKRSNFSTALAPINKKRNRYANVLANDTSRVKLEKARDGSDYINANHCLNGRVIISQGPKDNSSVYEFHHEDFYDMLWTNKSSAISMVTGFIEGYSIKCSHYLPKEGSDKIMGPYTISISDEIALTEEETALKTLGIRITKLHIQKKDEGSRVVTHYHYPNWGDCKGANAEVVAALARRLLSETKPIIHCSAGFGRSGTLAAVMACYDRILRGKNSAALVADVVNELRTERRGCVQTFEQYQTIYNTLKQLVQEDGKSSSILEKTAITPSFQAIPVIVNFNISDKKLFIRGTVPGMSWKKGIELKKVDGKFVFESPSNLE